MATINWTIQKNKHDLEYQKLLAEYSFWFSATFIVTLTFLGLASQVFGIKSLALLLPAGIFIFQLLDHRKVQTEKKLTEKLFQIEALKH